MLKKLYTSLIATFMLGSVFAQTAKVQIIHNAADPDLKTVDIYLDANLVANNITFRTATQFSDVSTGAHIISVAPSSSTSVLDAIVTKTVTLVANESYSVIAEGVKTPSNFQSNPDGVSTAAELIVLTGTLNRPTDLRNSPNNIYFHNGSSDTKSLSFFLRNKGVVQGLTFKKLSKQVRVEFNQAIDISYTNDQFNYFSSFGLTNLGKDSSFIILASGFMDSTKNKSGRSLDFFAVKPNGSWIALQDTTESAFVVQFINASADTNLRKLDVYYDSVLIVRNLEYKKATQYFELSKGQHKFVLAKGDSKSWADSIFTYSREFREPSFFSFVIHGLSDPSKFKKNPSNVSTALKFNFIRNITPFSIEEGLTQLYTFNAITDSKDLDVYQRNSSNNADTMVQQGVQYSLFGNFYFFETGRNTSIRIKESTTGNGFKFDGILGKIVDTSGIIVFSGFLDPANNQNGKPVEAWIVYPDGSVNSLSTTTAIEVSNNERINFNLGVYPNPTSGMVNVSVKNNIQYIRILDLNGKVVKSFENPSSSNITFSTENMPKGMYFLQTNLGTSKNKLIVQ